MTGRADPKLAIAQVIWPDAEIDRIEIDYDDLTLRLRDAAGAAKRVICEGHLGHELTGFWDEFIVEAAELADQGPFLDRCLASMSRRLGRTPAPSGNAVRNHAAAMQLTVRLIDGCELHVAMTGLRVEDDDTILS